MEYEIEDNYARPVDRIGEPSELSFIQGVDTHNFANSSANCITYFILRSDLRLSSRGQTKPKIAARHPPQHSYVFLDYSRSTEGISDPPIHH